MDCEGDEPSKRCKLTNDSQEPCLTIPTLPRELITNILSRLPVKSLLQFRSVSKSWLALISSPHFIKTHFSLSASNKDNTHHKILLSSNFLPLELKECSVSSLLNGAVTEAFELDYAFKHFGFPWTVGSVNGLVCFVIRLHLFIWNPSTRKSKKVPYCLDTPRSGSYVHGFGYDEFHDAYKIVRISSKSNGGVKVEIYNLRTDSWSTFDDFPCGPLHIDSFKFLNGKLHWVSKCSFRGYNCWDIVFIDLTEGKWGKVEQPCYREGEFSRILGVLRNDLSMFCIYERTYVDVWVMKEYGVKDSWTKMNTIKFPNKLMNSGLSPSFCMLNTGEILLVFGLTAIIYNPKDDSVRDRDLEAAGVPVEIYIEGLVSPTSQNEPMTQKFTLQNSG